MTWIFDETGKAGAILDEFCIRNLDGAPQAWVFGVSVFSLKGEHIGWFEHGVLFDIHNDRLGFLKGALGVSGHVALQPPSAFPAFAKRPCVPALRARRSRPVSAGWSGERLADYLQSCADRVDGLRALRVAPAGRMPAKPEPRVVFS